MKKLLLAGVAVLALAGTTAVYARHGGHDHHHVRMNAEDRAALADARIAAVHAGLKLTPDQDKLWPPVEEAVRGFAKLRIDRANARMAERQDERGDDAKGPRTPDNPVARLQQHADAMAATAAALKRIAETADPLYKTLDDGQKRRLAILTHMEGRPGGEGHRGMRDRDDEHDRGGPGRFDRDHGPGPDRL
ncbi:MAG: Spy/CpxP family protein refolding chaperone [Tardiphaga sp.]|nr:Spy/CpxP family protein refolding chaperone [Tardiphaga sp.]